VCYRTNTNPYTQASVTSPMVEYRPLDEEHRDTFAEYTGYGFAPERGPVEYDPEEHDHERMELGDRRGLFADGDDADPLSVCVHHWFDASVRGERHPAPGLSFVATPPEHRRQGYIEQLLARSLAEYRDRGERFSLLWPFRYRFYRQFGWETCSSHHAYTCEPGALSFARDRLDDAGQFRQVSDGKYEPLASVYEAFSERYAISIGRDGEWWQKRVFTGWEEDPYVYAWERDGEVRAYVVYFVEGSWGDRTMRVRDFVFTDHEGLLALCGYVANHDSQLSEVEFGLPTDVDLLALAPDPEDLDCEREPGAMARVVDAAETLPALQYPPVDCTVTIAVDDPLVDWHDAPLRLAVEDGVATCERRPGESDVDLTIDVGTLTQIVVGYRSAGELDRHGILDAPDDVVGTLDRLYPSERTYLGTGF